MTGPSITRVTEGHRAQPLARIVSGAERTPGSHVRS